MMSHLCSPWVFSSSFSFQYRDDVEKFHIEKIDVDETKQKCRANECVSAPQRYIDLINLSTNQKKKNELEKNRNEEGDQ